MNSLSLSLSPLDHNRIHAADVLHSSYYLITSPVPGFAADSPLSPIGELFDDHLLVYHEKPAIRRTFPYYVSRLVQLREEVLYT